MRASRLTPLILLLAVHASAAETPIDSAVTIRNTVLRAVAAQDGEVVAQVAAATTVEVFERERLWVRIAAAGDADATQGWLRFTELRFGGGAGGTTTSAAPEAGGFAGFSRSVSGFLSGFRGRGSRTAQKTSTIGIRGLTVADLEAARPDAKALAAVSRYSMSQRRRAVCPCRRPQCA